MRVREQWEDVETMDRNKLDEEAFRVVRSFGEDARESTPYKLCLFGSLPQTRPCGGPKKGWRDVVQKDLKALGVSQDWYSEAHWARIEESGELPGVRA